MQGLKADNLEGRNVCVYECARTQKPEIAFRGYEFSQIEK